MGGMAQMARFRQPGAAAIAFMNTLVPTAATFRIRARIARLPCRASAIPRHANTRAAASGIAASSPATTASRRVALDHPVLGGETHHRRGRSQQAQPGGGIPQPDARMVPAGRAPPGADRR